jgi:hypothetical protein
MARNGTTVGSLRIHANLVLLIVLVVLTGACRNPVQQEPLTEKGSLELALGSLARTILPIYDYGYSIDFYNISGTGPGGATFGQTAFTGKLYTARGLQPGVWLVSVTGLNAKKEPIASAGSTVEVFANQTITESLQFSRLEGTGSLDLDIRWYIDQEFAYARALLTPPDTLDSMDDTSDPPGDSLDTWTVTNFNARLLAEALPAGSYDLTIQLWSPFADPDSTDPAHTIEQTLEIFSGYTSRGIFPVASGAEPQDFLYHPDQPVYEVDFGTSSTLELTVRGADGLQLYLVKTNPSGTRVNALATGSAVSTWEYLVNSSSTSESLIVNQPGTNSLDRQEHEAALRFNANPPPIPQEAQARSLARTIAYGEPNPDYTEGITKKDFWVERADKTWTTISATLRAIGRYSYIWVADNNYDNGSTRDWDNKLTTAQAKLIRDKFDGTASAGYRDGIFRNVSTIFGHEYGGGEGGHGGRDGDQHISILLYDIDFDYSRTQTGGVFGYFWSKDFYPQEQLSSNLKTNYTEIFYLDAHFADKYPEAIYSTMAHEYQHMIHFNMKTIRLGRSSATWFNELCSMVAEDLVLGNIGLDPLKDGPQSRLDVFAYHYAESGVSDWLSGNEVLKSYASAFAFGAYLARNFGGAGFFHELMHNDQVNEAAISAAMAAPGALGNGKGFIQELLRYSEALVLTASQSGEGLRSLNREDTRVVPENPVGDGSTGTGISYTALSIDLGSMQQYNLATSGVVSNQSGLRTYLPSTEIELRPYGSSVHTQESWINIPGVFPIELVAPIDTEIRFYLIAR